MSDVLRSKMVPAFRPGSTTADTVGKEIPNDVVEANRDNASAMASMCSCSPEPFTVHSWGIWHKGWKGCSRVCLRERPGLNAQKEFGQIRVIYCLIVQMRCVTEGENMLLYTVN